MDDMGEGLCSGTDLRQHHQLLCSRCQEPRVWQKPSIFPNQRTSCVTESLGECIRRHKGKCHSAVEKASLPESSKSGFCSLSDLGKVVQFPGASVFLPRVMITWRQLLNWLWTLVSCPPPFSTLHALPCLILKTTWFGRYFSCFRSDWSRARRNEVPCPGSHSWEAAERTSVSDTQSPELLLFRPLDLAQDWTGPEWGSM